MLTHVSADSKHYDTEADTYDSFNEKNSKAINRTVERILKSYSVKSVVDFTCGTGSQVLWLARKGLKVEGYDINSKMLKIAKAKAKATKLNLSFKKGDIRTTNAGTFDAALSIFNAIGHLTAEDFKKALRNIHSNLKSGGLFIFDNFNFDYLTYKDNITLLTMDIIKQEAGVISREIQFSTIDDSGVLASYDTYIRQKGKAKPKVMNASQTLQTYSAIELKKILKECDFKTLKQCNVDGSRFNKRKSERILTVAKAC